MPEMIARGGSTGSSTEEAESGRLDFRVQCKRCKEWGPARDARPVIKHLDGGTKPGDRVMLTYICRTCDEE